MSWSIRSLAEVAPIRPRKPEPFDSARRYYSTGAVGKNGELDAPELVTFAERPSRANCMPRIGDVGFARMNGTQKVVLISEIELGSLFSTGFCFLEPISELDPKYLYYFLTSEAFQREKNALAGDGIMGGIKNADVENMKIPFPPLPEQQRIVRLLDEAFEAIAIAKANAEKNLQNALALFDNQLEQAFTQSDATAQEIYLSAVCAITSKLVDPQDKQYQALTHVGAGNIRSKTGEFINLHNAKEEALISGKFLFDKTMVLYSKIRPYLMKVGRPNFDGLCSADIYPLSPDEKAITRSYLYYLLITNNFTKHAVDGSARAGMPKANREHLFRYKFSLPPIEKQVMIVGTLDALRVETQRLSNLYEQNCAALEQLKQAMLMQAISGEMMAA